MSRNIFSYSAVVASLLATALFAGCGTSNKESGTVGGVAKVDESLCAQCHGSAREKLTGRVIYDDYAQSVHALNSVGCQDCHGGGAQHNGVGPIPFPKPNEEQCKTCHDSKGLVTSYIDSKHKAVVIENEEGEPCQRCHTHQGAVLAAQFGFTGDGPVMDAMVNAPGLIPNPEPIKCNTCHMTHKPQELRVDANWTPGPAVGVAGTAGNTSTQYKLCTQCHTYINPTGVLAGSGSTASGTTRVGHHETSWYRAIASTHYDNPATGAVEGYGVDAAGSKSCFDCHGHESKTNSNNDPLSSSYKAANNTIYTDWAQSAHAGNILTAKFAAAAANPVNTSLPRTNPTRVAQGLAQVDAVMAAGHTGGQFAGSRNANRLCVRCHTETGFREYYSTTGDVTVATPTVAKTEVITCRACHANAATGELRVMKGAKASPNYTTDLGHSPVTTDIGTGYALSYGKKAFPDVAGSNLCIVCHDGRTGDPAAKVNYNTGAAITSPTRPHDLPAAAIMYVKTGFLNLSTGAAGFANVSSSAAYRKTLMSDQDGGSVTSTHRKLGTPAIIGDTHKDKNGVATFATAATVGKLASNGPCVACHLTGSHSLKIDQKAIDAVCSRCHSSEAGNDISTLAAFEQHFLEPQKEVFMDAIALAYDIFNQKQSAIAYNRSTSGSLTAYSRTTTSGSGATLRPVYTATTYAAYLAGTGNQPASATNADWAAAAAAYGGQTKLFGALGNVGMFLRDGAAYAHARTYTRRLLYDSIDYLDDGILNMSVGATALTRSADTTSLVSGLYGKGTSAYTSGTLTTLTSGTTESMVYLLGWSRSTGAWNSTERP